MRILIVEDDPNKLAQLREHVLAVMADAELVERRSYQSGLKEIMNASTDLLLLDMTLPTYDVTFNERGGRTRAFAGRDILREMKRRRLRGRVVVVTQFESFGEGSAKKTLIELQRELTAEFPGIYMRTIYYHPSQSAWRHALNDVLKPL